jgi:hypothetical protein
MTAITVEAGGLLSSKGLRTPIYPETSTFSLRELVGWLRPIPQVRVSWSWEEPAWAHPVFSALADLLELRPNWDSYGGLPLTNENFASAIGFLARIMDDDTEPPWVVPLPSGGVQLEWHREDLDVEVVIDRDRSVVLIEDRGEELEAPLGRALSVLLPVLPRLARGPEGRV